MKSEDLLVSYCFIFTEFVLVNTINNRITLINCDLPFLIVKVKPL